MNGRFEGGYADALGIGYLASVLRENGLEVELFDPSIHDHSPAEMAHVVAHCRPSLVGVSVLSIECRPGTFELIRLLRRELPDAHICAGGRDPSMSFDHYLRVGGTDSACIGEGELTFVELARALRAGADWRAVPGLAFLRDDVIASSGPGRRIDDIDEIPFPARDTHIEYLTVDPDDDAAEIMSTRGCYAQCSFCTSPAFDKLHAGKRIRMRSVASVVSEMEYLADELGVRHFAFVDDVFVVPGTPGLRRAREFREALEGFRHPITFNMQCRVDAVSEAAIADLKAAGMNNIFLGVENWEDETLEVFSKGVSPQRADEALSTLNRVGFSTSLNASHRIRVGLITYHAETTLHTLRAQVAAAREWGLPPKRLNLRVVPFDGTTLQARYADRADLVNNRFAPDFTFEHEEAERHYAAWAPFIRDLSVYRDRIRDIEKAWRKRNLRADAVLVRGRAHLDETGYQAFEQLIGLIESDANDERVNDFVSRTQAEYRDAWDSRLLPRVSTWEARLQLGAHTEGGRRTKRVFD